ncbi:DUF1566 domain-containing protein [Flavobacteriales bacterium]|nr:DUF1566 domain-containing protein [Flavobacteriales bacterium]
MKKLIVLMFSIVLLGSCSKKECTDPLAINYDVDATKDDGSCEFIEIGDSYQGGIVFYLDSNNLGGLIAAPTDQSNAAEWGCQGTKISAGGTVIGIGNQNTIDIEAGCTTVGTAADICANLTLGGYSDWFLPSKDELNEMWKNLADSDGDGTNTGPSDPNNLGSFANLAYWSSSETDNDEAWGQIFDLGIQDYGDKVTTVYVRAVRAF